MGELNLYREYVASREEELAELNNEKAAKQRAIEEAAEQKFEAKERARLVKENFSNFKSFVKDALLQEAIKSIFIPCAGVTEGDIITDRYCQVLVESYVKDNDGAEMIFLRNKSNTYFIESLHNLINKYYDIIIEGADPENPDTCKINGCDMKDFLDDLNKEDDYQSIKAAIRDRVINAEEEFLANSMADKASMEDIMQQTKDKIDTIQADENIEDTAKDAIAQEAAQYSKRRIDNVRERKNKSILEMMIENLSVKAYADPNTRKDFTLESGALNVPKIIDTCKCMYSLMETLSTTKLEKVDEIFIKESLQGLS